MPVMSMLEFAVSRKEHKLLKHKLGLSFAPLYGIVRVAVLELLI